MPMNTSLLTKQLQELRLPLATVDHLDPLIEQLKRKQVILLGEASHGTAEYYLWRSALTKRLIAEGKVSFIAVEGDWPDTYEVNRYIKGYSNSGGTARDVLHAYSRWPTWMWANTELIEFIEWLRNYNRDVSEEKKIGFYGMDVYSLWASMEAVVQYLKKVDPKAAEKAKNAYRCFEPYHQDEQNYAFSQSFVPRSCESAAMKVLQDLPKSFATYPDDPEGKFSADQNAFVAVQAEEYYRTMLQGDVSSWNFRDTSMAQTLDRLSQFYHHKGKMIIWAHNTHVGDARYTDMEQVGMINIGQLLREKYGEEKVGLVGFATYSGSVIAASQWDGLMEVMDVPPAQDSSWEDLIHQVTTENSLFLFHDSLEKSLRQQVLGQRAIGVVYDPRQEYGNYVPTLLSKRYDALLFIHTTHALHPLHMKKEEYPQFPETYPSTL